MHMAGLVPLPEKRRRSDEDDAASKKVRLPDTIGIGVRRTDDKIVQGSSALHLNSISVRENPGFFPCNIQRISCSGETGMRDEFTLNG
jgi:hypothetical protein